MDLFSFLNSHNIDALPTFDGQIHRFKGQSKKSKSGWYCGFESGDSKYLVVGDWANGDEPVRWSNKKKNMASNEFAKFCLDASLKARAQRESVAAEAAAEAVRHLSRNLVDIPVSDFEYCKKKKIDHLNGASFCEDAFGVHLAVPIMSGATGETVVSLQKIYADGVKMFLSGGKKRGCYFVIGDVSTHAYLCEGYATAASINMATGSGVIVAFDAGNIDPVCEVFSDRGVKITIAADNDQFSSKNTGVEAAKKAGFKYGFPVVIPEFVDKSGCPTDFNDLFCIYGADEVVRQLSIKSEVVVADDVGKNIDQYLEFKMLFEKIFPGFKRCLLTDEVTYESGYDRSPVLNKINLARSEALIAGMDRGKVEDHIGRWVDKMPKSLLCNITEKKSDHDYIGELFSYVSVSNIKHEYFVELMKYWLCGIFNRLENSHFQNRMVIFHGDQGLGKDTFIFNMLSGLDPYFSNSGIHEKEIDNYAIMARNLVINVSEFDRTSKLQVSQLKNIITADRATFRAPYARSPATVNFKTSFISSCNIEDIFRDETGNRRFMFFKLSHIDWDYPKGMSGAILSQAMDLAKSGYKPSNEAMAAMSAELNEMTPESWESFADELWQDRVENLVTYKSNPKLNYADVSPVVREISLSLGVSQRMVQSYIKRHYQCRDMSSRFYVSRKIGIESTRQVN